MNRKLIEVLVTVFVLMALVLSGCAAPAQEAPKEITVVVEKEGETVVEVVTATPEPAEKVELPDEIVIGIVQPLTGWAAVYGKEGQIGTELAIKHINEAGGIKSLGGLMLTTKVEDAGDSPDSAKLATESMISKNHPVAILGMYISRFVMAASEVTDREKVILIADALVPQITQMGRQYLFRPGPTASDHGKMAYQFVKESAAAEGVEITGLAVLNEDSANGRANTLGATEAALMDQFPVVRSLEYPYDITDATSIVQELQKVNPDVIIHTPYFNDAIVFGKAFEEVGWYPKILAGAGACGYVDPASIESLGDIAEGISMTFSYDPYKDAPANAKFVEEYKAEYGVIPTEGAGMNYYGAWVLAEALELSGTMFPDDPLKPENLRAAFMALDLSSGPAVESYPGNHIKFTPLGDNESPGVIVLQVQDGVPITVYPEDAKKADPIVLNPHYQP